MLIVSAASRRGLSRLVRRLLVCLGGIPPAVVADEEPLTLEDTLTRVLEANLRLRVARGDHAVAEQRRAAEW